MPINRSESTKKVRLDLKGLTPQEKQRAKEAAGSILVEEINNSLDSSTSPVKNGKFKALKADNTASFLFEDGSMRQSITFDPLDEDAVDVGIFQDSPRVERLKGFNHNNGDTLPQRRFIAAPNQKFKDSIMTRVNNAINDIRDNGDREFAQLVNEILDV